RRGSQSHRSLGGGAADAAVAQAMIRRGGAEGSTPPQPILASQSAQQLDRDRRQPVDVLVDSFRRVAERNRGLHGPGRLAAFTLGDSESPASILRAALASAFAAVQAGALCCLHGLLAKLRVGNASVLDRDREVLYRLPCQRVVVRELRFDFVSGIDWVHVIS